MPSARVVVDCRVVRSARVKQLEGMFHVPPTERAERCWDVSLPLEDRDWHVGLIVGPSGSGKSTVARHLFGDHLAGGFGWGDGALIDSFPKSLGIKEVTGLLSSVGLSSPPAWLRPFAVLSTGEQFRVHIARVLAEQPDLAVVDEFTSVVDRTVAQMGSYAVQKAVRRRGQRLIAVTCHEDVEEWLEPDWTYRPDTNDFHWGCLQRRPAIELEVCRVPASTWPLFRQHHYLDTDLNKSARCFGAFWRGRLVGFMAWLNLMSGSVQGGVIGHRLVTIPDYQGAGIGNHLSQYTAQLWRALGKRAFITTSHPARIHHLSRSPFWRSTRKPGHTSPEGKTGSHSGGRASRRLTAGFEYVGPALAAEEARRVVDCFAVLE